ncbi:oligosaccharide flippase family protein [Halorussus limi]|uniref:Oligosaccharide flippase family protein n=1 Tax=Halorussus limi TaxID=2938695 RepID=A0A8U0HUP2_9EURY|nr:oligosaccharide flippase family protein [Halorussus limi]UPV74374.1 oligosaccharide flippase family protein [Halorussus limi]
MDLKRFARSFKAMLSARVLHMAASGVLMVVLARFLLTQEEYGLLGAALAVLGVVQLFTDLGLAKAAARYITEYRETDPGQVPHVLRTAVVYRLGTILVVGTLFALLGGYIADLIGQPEIATLLVVGTGYIAVHSVFTFSQVLFQGYNQITNSAVIRAVGSVARLALAATFVLVVGGAVGALVGYIVGYGLGGLLGLALLYRKCYRDVEKAERAEAGLKRRIARYSVPLTATRGANILDKRVDTILVGYFMNPVAVSYYYLSKQIVGFIHSPAASLGFTLSPAYGEHKAEGETDHAAQIYETTLKYILLLYVPAAAGIVIVAEPAIALVFGEKWVEAAPVLQVFAAYVVLQAVSYVTGDTLDFLGRARERAIAKGGGSVANFLLNLVMIPAFGVVGAAAATVVTHAAVLGVTLWVIHAELSLSVGELVRHFVAVAAVTGAMSAAVLAVLAQVAGALAVVVSILAGVAVWAGLSVAGGLLDLRRVRTILT